MRINPLTKELYTDDGQLIKKLNCSFRLNWSSFKDKNAISKLCEICSHVVTDSSKLSDIQAIQLIKLAPDACFKVDLNQNNINLMKTFSPPEENLNTKNLLIIRTARKLKKMNKAIKNGFDVLVKEVKPSKNIRSKFAVMQHKITGEVVEIHDYRDISFNDSNSNFEMIIDWKFTYPHYFKSPYAAYLIPKGLEPGTRVFLKDLIEDFVGTSWNQGDSYRLKSSEAIWNGKDFEIQYDPKIDNNVIFG